MVFNYVYSVQFPEDVKSSFHMCLLFVCVFCSLQQTCLLFFARFSVSNVLFPADVEEHLVILGSSLIVDCSANILSFSSQNIQLFSETIQSKYIPRKTKMRRAPETPYPQKLRLWKRIVESDYSWNCCWEEQMES